MDEFIHATPTAELTPLSAGVQDDESESEMVSFAEHIDIFSLQSTTISRKRSDTNFRALRIRSYRPSVYYAKSTSLVRRGRICVFSQCGRVPGCGPFRSQRKVCLYSL